MTDQYNAFSAKHRQLEEDTVANIELLDVDQNVLYNIVTLPKYILKTGNKNLIKLQSVDNL